MTNFEKKKNVIEKKNLTYPWWPFPKEVFQRTSYIKIKEKSRNTFVLSTTKTSSLSLFNPKVSSSHRKIRTYTSLLMV